MSFTANPQVNAWKYLTGATANEGQIRVYEFGELREMSRLGVDGSGGVHAAELTDARNAVGLEADAPSGARCRPRRPPTRSR